MIFVLTIPQFIFQFLIFRMDPGSDVLIRWAQDGTQNVVSASSLQWVGDLKKGVHVIWEWGEDPWNGIVMAVEDDSSESSDSDDDNLPLSIYRNASKDIIYSYFSPPVWFAYNILTRNK